MTAQKMPANAAKVSKKSRLSAFILLPRIAIYSTVVAGIIASFYDFKLGTLSILSGTKYSEAKKYIASINQAQQAYYAEYGQFSDDIAKLGLGIKEQGDNHTFFQNRDKCDRI